MTQPQVIFKDRAAARVPPAPPVDTDEPPPLFVDSSGTEYRDALGAGLAEIGEIFTQALTEQGQHFALKLSKIETEIAKLAGENTALKLALEHVQREPGPKGVRGLKGERGEPGREAARIVSWVVDEQAFSAVPVMSDLSQGAPLSLRGLLTSIAKHLAEGKR
jgi:hypothetical protein